MAFNCNARCLGTSPVETRQMFLEKRKITWLGTFRVCMHVQQPSLVARASRSSRYDMRQMCDLFCAYDKLFMPLTAMFPLIVFFCLEGRNPTLWIGGQPTSEIRLSHSGEDILWFSGLWRGVILQVVTLKLEAIPSSETLVNTCKVTWRHNPQGHINTSQLSVWMLWMLSMKGLWKEGVVAYFKDFYDNRDVRLR